MSRNGGLDARPRILGWQRLAGWRMTLVVMTLIIAAVGESLGALIGGRLAGGASDQALTLVAVLAVLLVGAVAFDTTGSVVTSVIVARAERRLRADLLDSVLRQPLSRLQEQAVGELMDRVDDDVAQLGILVRLTGVSAMRAGLRLVLAWILAGVTWPPGWIVLPLVAAAALLISRPAGRRVWQRQIDEEVIWSAHAAQMEEAVAGRDDIRTALGQPFVLRHYATLARQLFQRVGATSAAAGSATFRTVLLPHVMVAALVVVGVLAVSRGAQSVTTLVTLWLLAGSFVGQLTHLAHSLPDIQAGIGALARIRSLLNAPREDPHGLPMPDAPPSIRFSALDFAFDSTVGTGFALRGITIDVPAQTTCALVGRTGSGKSTLASFVSRAIEPPPGTTFVAGQDVRLTDLEALRRTVGVVTQRTEVLSATLLENVTLFADVPRATVAEALTQLGLDDWVASLPHGLDTVVGPGGVSLSAGEEQLVAFARLLVRDVRIVILDEATARMDPETEQMVVGAADRLLANRTGLVIAHRLATIQRCDTVAVLDGGHLVQHGRRADIVNAEGPLRALLESSSGAGPANDAAVGTSATLTRTTRHRRPPAVVVQKPNLALTVLRLLRTHPHWGALGAAFFSVSSLLGIYGPASGWLWGHIVAALNDGRTPWWAAAFLTGCLLAAPVAQALAVRIYSRWWVGASLRLRLAVLHGQTQQRRLHPLPAGDIMARALDSDRLVRYADRWVFVVLALVSAMTTAALSRNGYVLLLALAVLVLTALVATVGAPLAGRAARVAGDSRTSFGRSLVSVLEAIRTVKLSGAGDTVQRYLGDVDIRRVRAHVRESRIRAVLDGVPAMLLQISVVAAWALYAIGRCDVQTALLIVTAISGFQWSGMVMAAVVTEAPIARSWLTAAAQLAGTDNLVRLPTDIDLVAGKAPLPLKAARVPLRELTLRGLTVVHENGMVGMEDVDITVRRGQVILLTGRIGSGKSSLLRCLAGLVDYEGTLLWNGREVTSPQHFLRPGQVSYVGQVPHLLSGSFRDNVVLDHDRSVELAYRIAQLEPDLDAPSADSAPVGHRGGRLSGGQVQRLALARALAADADLLIADDVSSAIDARTEAELWRGLRTLDVTVIGASSRRLALQQADLVVVVEDGRVVDTGPWRQLARRWGRLAG